MANLTPADVRNVAFRKPPLGKRGYDEEEVDGFLELVEETIAALQNEIAALRAGPAGFNHLAFGTSGAADEAVMAELDQIKVRLARIEAAVTPREQRRPLLPDPARGY